MTDDEYNGRKQGLNDRHNARLKRLAREYALSHNPVKVGDVIEDDMGSIIVESMRFTYSVVSCAKPSMVYSGKILTKAKSISKRKDNTRDVFQCRMERHALKGEK